MLGMVLAFSLAIVSCSHEGSGVPELPAIDEATTGRPSITYTNIALSGEGASAFTMAQYNNAAQGYTIAVTAGKMTLSLTTPSSPVPVNTVLSANSGLFKGAASNNASANIVDLDPFDAGSSYGIGRIKTDQATYANMIYYVYVSADVILTGTAHSESEESFVVNYAAFSLPLKRGWNLVQRDQNVTTSSMSGTSMIKIADKNVPWALINSGP
jgi:hypothetical protein